MEEKLIHFILDLIKNVLISLICLLKGIVGMVEYTTEGHSATVAFNLEV